MRRSKRRLPFKRRRESKTDYNSRLKLLVSRKHRLVVRKSLKHTKAQIVEYSVKGDKVVASASSEELGKFGWKASTSNLPSAYLVGLLLGKRALEKKTDSAILDMGIHKSVKGSKIYAVLKGVLDAGVNVPHSEEMLPKPERITGKHIIDYAQKLAGKSKSQFTKTDVKNIEAFEGVKAKIMKG